MSVARGVSEAGVEEVFLEGGGGINLRSRVSLLMMRSCGTFIPPF